MRWFMVAMAITCLSACTSNTTTIITSPPSSPSLPETMATPGATSPSLPASIDANAASACAALADDFRLLKKSLKGQSGHSTVDDMASIVKDLNEMASSVQGTQAGADLQNLVDEAKQAANSPGLGALLNRIDLFIKDATAFGKAYCGWS
jgi:hypothetical protein